MKLRRMGLIVGVLLLALAVAACGGKKESGGSSAQDAVEVVVELGASGNEFSFSPDQLTLKANQPVKLVAKNVGTVQHDLHIPELGVSITAVAAGQQKSVEFIPSKVGQFKMECREPGHVQMIGTVSVVQ